MQMRKRHRSGSGAEVHFEAWLLPYADMITLLLAFFIILYAISLEEVNQRQAFAASIREAFSILPMETAPPAPGPETLSSPGSREPSFITGQSFRPGSRRMSPAVNRPPRFRFLRGEALDDLQLDHLTGCAPGNGCPLCESDGPDGRKSHPFIEEIRRFGERFQDLLQAGDMEIGIEDRGLRIRLQPDLLFASGSAQLQDSSRELIQELTELLQAVPGSSRIDVEGHTDNRSIQTFLYPSNWELSTARATTVVRQLVLKNNRFRERLRASGYADTRPLADNRTVPGRKLNRRVEIIVTEPRWQEPQADLLDIAMAAVSGAAGQAILLPR